MCCLDPLKSIERLFDFGKQIFMFGVNMKFLTEIVIFALGNMILALALSESESFSKKRLSKISFRKIFRSEVIKIEMEDNPDAMLQSRWLIYKNLVG